MTLCSWLCLHQSDSLLCPRACLHYPHSRFFSPAFRARCSLTFCSAEQHAKLPRSCCASLAAALAAVLSGRGREKLPRRCFALWLPPWVCRAACSDLSLELRVRKPHPTPCQAGPLFLPCCLKSSVSITESFATSLAVFKASLGGAFISLV